MPIVKIRTNRQVTIPKLIFDDMGLQEGGFVEVIRNKDHIVIRPKKLVDAGIANSSVGKKATE